VLLDHPKYKSIPIGLGCGSPKYDKKLYELSQNDQFLSNSRKNKILCIWNMRDFNVCGKEYIQRPFLTDFVKRYPEIFDYYDANLNVDQFLNLILSYTHILLPFGNGVDLCPKLLESICCKTIPICLSNINTLNIQSQTEFPCIILKNWEEMLDPDFFMKHQIDLKTNYKQVIHNFSSEFWANKIKNCV
jgi:hypothetical protein